MAEIRPAQFPRLMRTQMQLTNLVLNRQLTLELALDDVRLALHLGPAPPDPGYASIAVRLADGLASLAFEPALLQRCLQPWIGETPLSSLPPVLQEAARQAALSPWLETLASGLGLSLTLADSDAPALEPSATLGLWLAKARVGTPGAWLHLDASAMVALSTVLERQPLATDPGAWLDLPVACLLWLGQTRLHSSELADLAVEDLLLWPAAQNVPEVVLRQRQPWAVAELAGHQLLIKRLLVHTMSDSDTSFNEDETPIAAEALDVRLDFDLGHLTLPLRELQALQPGQAFALDPPGPRRVRIRVGGQLIGHGELVEIDERLGVRVTALFNHGPPPEPGTPDD